MEGCDLTPQLDDEGDRIPNPLCSRSPFSVFTICPRSVQISDGSPRSALNSNLICCSLPISDRNINCSVEEIGAKLKEANLRQRCDFRMANSKFEYVKEFENDVKLSLYNWIIVRIDGCHFHRFSADHMFDKPNDENALKLMNSSAVAMLQHFPDIVFAYGVSDECSFIWKETTRFYQRRESKILSLSVSYFTSVYVMKWKEFFPHKELKEPPYFDGRVVCYPRVKIVRDYLAWRQVDCHINNQYNTCFWMLVNSGKTVREAQEFLKGTQSKDKNELLFQQFQINYDKLPAMFRKGSCVFRDKVEVTVKLDDSGNPVKRTRMKVTVDHFDIIGPKFWNEHPYILNEELK